MAHKGADAQLPKSPKKTTSKKSTTVQKVVLHRCIRCGSTFSTQSGNFLRANNPWYEGNGGYMDVCKECVNKVYASMFEHYGNERMAIRSVCRLFNLYYTESMCDAALNKSANSTTPIMASIIGVQAIFKSTLKTYTDTLDEEARDNITETSLLEDGLKEVPKESRKRWGMAFKPEEYIYLDDLYSEWASRVVIDKLSTEELVKNLCINKLQQQKALQSNDNDTFMKLAKQFEGTLKEANLSPKQVEDNDKAGEMPLGVCLERWETTRPVPPYTDKGYWMWFFTVYCIGHLCAMLKIRNKYSDMYRAEMDRYKAEYEISDDEDEEDIFSTIYDSMATDIEGDDSIESDDTECE